MEAKKMQNAKRKVRNCARIKKSKAVTAIKSPIHENRRFSIH